MSDIELSQKIEQLLVARNLRGMQTLSSALKPGYIMRAASMIKHNIGTVLIGTGFPVDSTFETDGPVGAIALYRAIQILGGKPILVCCDPLAKALKSDYNVHSIAMGSQSQACLEAQQGLQQFKPSLLIAIEHPGLTASNNYRNMRGEDISSRCSGFDYFLSIAQCPTIGIGDGGNEAGMGNIRDALIDLDIMASVIGCDELVIADVSNWAAHGILAYLSYLEQNNLLQDWDNLQVLKYLSARGSVDGVTRENALTEDGLESTISESLIEQLKKIVGF